jgi:hypothetical protein
MFEEMGVVYANIVNLDPNNGVVQSFTTHPLFHFIRFYPDYDDPSLDPTLPTLYVGYREVKSRHKIDILRPQFAPMSWWVASPQEDAMRFLKGFQAFMTGIAPALVEGLTVTRSDPFFGPAYDSADLLGLLTADELLVAYLRRDTLYLYTAADRVLVLDLTFYQAFGVQGKKLTAYVREHCRHYHDDSNNAIYHFFVNKFEYGPSEVSKYIPYLIWLKVRTPTTEPETPELTVAAHS